MKNDDAEHDFRKVLVLDGPVEAELLDSVLTERQIPHIMRPYHDSVYDGLFEASKGWGHIEAPSPHHETIRGIYRDLREEGGM